MRRIALAVVLIAATSGCMDFHRRAPVTSAPAFDAVAVFTGENEALGLYRRVLRQPAVIAVRMSGRFADGHLQLDQRVRIANEGGVRRRFDLLHDGAGRWTGTLSTSSKPVTATSRGNVFHLGYFAEDGLRYDEYFHLLPDGTIAYRAAITDHAVEFARIDGTVRRRAMVAARR